MEKKKIGRPVGTTGVYKEIKRDTGIHIRLTKGELEMIGNLSKKLGISRANTIVKAIQELDEKLK